jgi:hypothetical protein
MTEEQQQPKTTRRPPTLTEQLTRLRTSKVAEIRELEERETKLAAKLRAAQMQLEAARAEVERLDVAIGSASGQPLPVHGRSATGPVVEVVRTHADGTETVDSTHTTVEAAVAAANGEARALNGAAE